jgi:hypothetical protein
MSVAAAALAAPALLAPAPVSAESLLDFLFGGLQKPQRGASSPSSVFVDPFASNPYGTSSQATPPRTVAAGSGPAFCVRTCDGRYFPLMRGTASPAQMCQAFCPASTTKVYFGANIEGASASNGERYTDSENAYVFRKALRAECTCNGRDPAGLAPVDLALDSSLRPGDVVATTDGLVVYSGLRVGNSQTAEFIPIASYPGLTAEVRARLGEIRVAPVNANAEMVASEAPAELRSDVAPATSVVPKTVTQRSARRAAAE